MNELLAVVTRIIEEPWQQKGRWFVKVKANCYGDDEVVLVTRSTKKEIDQVTIGTKVSV